MTALRSHHGAGRGLTALFLATLMTLASAGAPAIARAAPNPVPATRAATTPVAPPAVQPRIATSAPIAPAATAATPTALPAPVSRPAPTTTIVASATAAPIPTGRQQVVEKPTATPTATAPPITIDSTGGAVTGVSPSSGPSGGGTNVTVTGSGFWKFGTSVTFGGVAATNVTFVDSATITCTTPVHAAGTVTVVESDSKGTSTTLSNGFTYTAVPVVTTISPASGPLAGGTSVTITGTGFAGATAVTFDGIAATGFTVNSATQITATTPADTAGAVDVAVTTAGGTGTLAGGYTYIGTLAITAAPGNFSYSANLTGDVLPLTSSFAVGVDAGGTSAGWNLQASIGALKTAGGDTIPAASHTIRSVAVGGVTGTAPTNGITYPLAIPTASGKVYNAAAGTGTGQATMTFNTQVLVPPDAAAGTYTATLTVTIAAGP
jgi:hypothetical protein